VATDPSGFWMDVSRLLPSYRNVKARASGLTTLVS
jgi:hypothetical protein